MAFREAEGMGADEARRVAGRWLREFLLEDWGLKVLAIVITLVLWFAVTGQRAPETRRLSGIALEYQRPGDMEISNDPLNKVDVTLEASKGKLDEINANNLVARVDISQLQPGERILRLTNENVSMSLPDAVRVVRIEPYSVALKLERSVERELDVEAKLDGEPAEGYEVRSVLVTPARIRVRGPESHVNALVKATTETIQIDGQKGTLNPPPVAVDVRDPNAADARNTKVVPLDTVVAVRVEIGEVQDERRIAGVAVRSMTGATVAPQTAVVVVRGPRSVVARLRSDDVTIIVEQATDGPVRPRLSLPSELSGRVELVSTTPSEFTILK